MSSKLKAKPAIDLISDQVKHEIHADGLHEYKSEPLRIGIDGNEANVERRVGSNNVAFKILKGLHDRSADEYHTYTVYLKEKPMKDFPKENKHWKYKVIPMKRFWTILRLPWELLMEKQKNDVFFSPGHYAPFWCPSPLVNMVLDTAYFDFPEYFRSQDLKQLKSWTARSVNRAQHVIAISQHTKNDVMKHYGKFDQQVTVAHMGIDHKHFFFPQLDKQINKVKDKYKIPGDYLLYVGTLQPRKNLIKLMESFKLLLSKLEGKTPKDSSVSYEKFSLVIGGKKGWMYDDIFSKVKELGLDDRVIFTDFVPDEDLPALMAGARGLMLVSLYEGFGIPVIEAMAVGTPSIVSRVSSLPEILGNAGYTVDPKNIEDMAEKMFKLLQLSSEEYYELTDKGIKHASLFTWEKTTNTVLKVLEHLGGRPT